MFLKPCNHILSQLTSSNFYELNLDLYCSISQKALDCVLSCSPASVRMSTGAPSGSVCPFYSHYLPHQLSSIPLDMTVHPSAGLTEAPADIELMSTALIQ